jgi:hypothetical protein
LKQQTEMLKWVNLYVHYAEAVAAAKHSATMQAAASAPGAKVVASASGSGTVELNHEV